MSLRLLHYADIENAYDDPERIGRLASVVRRRRDETTLVCGAGDTTAPGVLARETDGKHACRFFRAVDPDVSTFGNHEFDLGAESLRELVAATPQQWVTANIRVGDGARPFAAERGVQRTAVVSAGTERVGVVGVSDPRSIRDHPVADGVTVVDPLEAAADAVDACLADGVDFVVVLSHVGTIDDELARLEGVDAVLGGHVHDVRSNVVAGTPVVHVGERAELVSEVRLTEGTPEVVLHRVPDAPVATDVETAYRELFAEIGLDETVVTLETPVARNTAARYPESRVGNTVADAYRWAAGADVAVCHAGMFRAGPPLSGDVTVGDLRSLTPFDNEIHATQLTGAELVTLFENLATPSTGAKEPDVIAHVSGASLSWRRTAADIELVSATVAGTSPDPEAAYEVAAPSFAFASGSFPPLARDRIETTHGHQRDVLVEYVRRHGFRSKRDGRMEAVVDTASDAVDSLR
ncbi:bifunctional metallophosphatase/5'-nucleotidase [Halopiger djelfimassiliensis]|uniref:bifunctional metallophosphatase/5'-nucleotidase n=1 Tax=Halopiger djelfimassiliensis TaxID=1293047 RepID=UPI0006781448|nr:bifunctional metallophosphatase/5'-nucleotidase [Halopiger djelfimassiliensis]